MIISSTKAKNKGFTLIELAIAIAVIGIIVAMLFNKFGKSFITTAKAEAVYSNAQQVAESWKMLTNLCGTDLHPSNSTLSKAGAHWTYNLILLIDPEHATYGIDKIKYRRCYAQSGFTGLSSILKQEAGCSWNAWNCNKLGEYHLNFSNYYATEKKISIMLIVPTEIAEQLWLNYNTIGSTVFNPSAAEGTVMSGVWHDTQNAAIAGHTRIEFFF